MKKRKTKALVVYFVTILDLERKNDQNGIIYKTSLNKIDCDNLRYDVLERT